MLTEFRYGYKQPSNVNLKTIKIQLTIHKFMIYNAKSLRYQQEMLKLSYTDA